MPIKKDGTGKRWVEMEFVAPGTPEQVWQAMATGPGNAAWFTKATIEERVGGAFRFDFSHGASSSGEVTVWDPPYRLGYVERDWSAGAPPVATEITVTSRSGDRCVVRMVHSLFSTSDEWDDQMEGFEAGWPAFFEVLRLYLTHFAGMPAASFMAVVSTEGDPRAIWKRLTDQLEIAGAEVGDHRTTRGPEQVSGMIESVRQDRTQRTIIMHVDAPAPGVALIGAYGSAGKVTPTICLYFYGEGAAQTATAGEQRWQEWLTHNFAPVGAAEAGGK